MLRSERIRVLEGDALEVLRREPDGRFTAVVTDPPYGLSEPPPFWEVMEQWRDHGDYFWPKAGGGFMGAEWDRFVPGPALWREVLRTLRPGGIALVFAGARTAWIMAASMAAAGFEIVGSMPWLNGQGFPKAGDLGKAIDRRRHDRDQILACTAWIRARCAELGLKPKDLDRLCGTTGMGAHWISKKSQPYVPTREQWAKLEPALGPMPPHLEAMRLIIDAREPGPNFKAREVVGVRRKGGGSEPGNGATEFFGKAGGEAVDSLPHSPEAAAWTGWSPALKPGNEPVIIARKPAGCTFAECAIVHGTGSFHVDACRLAVAEDDPVNTAVRTVTASAFREGTTGFVSNGIEGERRSMVPDGGRWPPDVIFTHDAACDEDACVEGCPVAALDAQSGERASGSRKAGAYATRGAGCRVYEADGELRDLPEIVGSVGGASRFFPVTRWQREGDLDGFKYAGKARDGDRNAGLPPDIKNEHPTVKPLEVMEWLCRLVGHEAGEILDPFGGSGTTARACALLGFACTAIEREIEFAELCRLRSGLPATASSGLIRLRNRLRAAAVPRPRAKGRPVRPPTPGVPEVAALGEVGRAEAEAWLAATSGDARIAPPPAGLAAWAASWIPPEGGAPAPAPAPASAPSPEEAFADLEDAVHSLRVSAEPDDGSPPDLAEVLAAAEAAREAARAAAPPELVAQADAVAAAIAANLKGALDAAAPIPWEAVPDFAPEATEPAAPPKPRRPPRARRKREDAALRAAAGPSPTPASEAAAAAAAAWPEEDPELAAERAAFRAALGFPDR